MINLTSLNSYIIELDFFTKSFIEQRIRSYGVDKVLENQFKSLDCTKLTSDGKRIQQTTGYTYKDEISQTLYIIKNYCTDKDKLYEELLATHSANLKFEEDNPPEVSTYKPKRTRTRKDSEGKEKKETVAQRKLREKAAKIGALKLNIKPK